MRGLIFSLFVFVSFCSCSNQKPNLDKNDMLAMLLEADPQLQIMVPESISKPLVYCHDYRPACITGYKVKIKNLEVVGLYYEDQEQARKSARAIRGYHLRNWAFDQVSGEPILERFFETRLKAQKIE